MVGPWMICVNGRSLIWTLSLLAHGYCKPEVLCQAVGCARNKFSPKAHVLNGQGWCACFVLRVVVRSLRYQWQPELHLKAVTGSGAGAFHGGQGCSGGPVVLL